MRAGTRICNTGRRETDGGMTDWEQPHWSGRPQPRPDARPRLKPGVFAKLARFCASYHMAVLALFFTAALLAGGFAAVTLTIEPDATPQINFDPQTEAARLNLRQHFPAAGASFMALVSGNGSGSTRATALAIAAELQKADGLYSSAFVPGTGDYYDRYGIVFQDAPELEVQVALAQQMQPLYQALAAAPDIRGLTALVVEIARSILQGRSPPGLESLLNATAETVEGEIAGKRHPIYWQRLAGLTAETQSLRWFVIATPVPGAEREAADFARRLTGPVADVTWLWPNQSLGVSPDPMRDLAVPAGLAALSVLTILAAGLGAIRFVLPVVLASLATLSLSAGAAAAIGPRLDGATWSFASAVLAPALLLNICLVLAHIQARQRGSGVRHAIMLAAHRRGGLLVTLASIFVAFWLSWMVRQIPSLASFSVIALAGTAIALLTALTLMPAALAAFDRDAAPVYDHWVDAAIAGSSSTHSRNAGQVASMLVIAAGVFCAIFLPGVRLGEKLERFDPPVMLDTPDARGAIHVLTAPGEAAGTMVQQLAGLPEVGAIRWIEQFMPAGVEAKTGLLRGLEGYLAVPPNQRPPADAASLDTAFAELKGALQLIAGNPATGDGLRQSAQRLRQALGLYANPAPPSPGHVLSLEDAIFGGMPRLAQAADQLAKLPAPQLADLPAELRRLYVADDGLWRIEVMPKPNVSTLNFAAAVRKLVPQASGEPILGLVRNEIMHHESGIAFAAALTAAMILGFAALRGIGPWLLTLLPAVFFFTLGGACMVSIGLALNAAMLAGVSTTAALSIASAILLAEGAGEDQLVAGTARAMAFRAALLPILVLAGTVAPLALSSDPPVAAFGVEFTMFLGLAFAINAILVPGSAQWLRHALARA